MSVKYGMVIDLHQCVGCGSCALACKAENNTQARAHGQSFNWADFVMKTEGEFPNTTYVQMPVLCGHCDNAPCIEECPTEPKAMFRAPDNTVLFNQERCIGCGACLDACPNDAILRVASTDVVPAEAWDVVEGDFVGSQVILAEPAELPVRTHRPGRLAGLTGMALASVGSWLLPRAADALLDAMERRLVGGVNSIPAARPLSSANKTGMRSMIGGGRGRRYRQRQRRRQRR